MYPQAKSVGSWLRHGWHVALAYVVGFAALMLTLGWQPHAPATPEERLAPAAGHAALILPGQDLSVGDPRIAGRESNP
jgi:hypothetical protein